MSERARPGGHKGKKVTAPLEPTNPSLPVHRAAAKRAERYCWEPFQRGNALSIRHGARSQRVFGPLAKQLADGLLEACPDLGDPRYRAAVTRWSEAEAQESLLMFELDRVVEEEGIVSERAEKVQHSLDRVRSKSQKLRADLGLTPRGHVELVSGRAAAEREYVDLAGLRARGRAEIEARAREEGES